MEGKRMKFEGVMAIVIAAIVAIICLDGILINKLPMEALRYPLFCAAVVMLTAAIEIVKAVRNGTGKQKPIHKNARNFAVAAALMVGYIILMWLFGFIVSSIALTIAFTVIYKMEKPVAINIGAAVVIIAVYLIFSRLLYIFLPEGLFFEWLF